MPDIAPRYRHTPLVMIARPDAGQATAHLCGPATGTLCGLPASTTHAAFTQADLLLLELMVGGAVPCPMCADIIRRQVDHVTRDPATDAPVDPSVDPGAA